MKKCILSFLVGLILYCAPIADAYQFEDYEWDASLEDVKDSILSKYKHLTLVGESLLEYEDQMYNAECKVLLIFTPKPQKLMLIRISWLYESIGHNLKRKLINTYGEPAEKREESFGGTYVWTIERDQETLRLTYTPQSTELIYKGGRYVDEEHNELE